MKNSPGRKILSVLLLGALGACESNTLPVDAADVAEIRVVPQGARVELESSLQLDAELLDAAGNPVSGRPLFWSSENSGVARVSAQGEVLGVATGSTRVAASADGMSGVTTVDVVPRAVIKVLVSPPTTNLFVRESATLSATVLDRTDRPLEGRVVTWTSADSLIAAVDANGGVSARAEGTVLIRATSEGVTGEATVVVSRIPVATVEVLPANATLFVGDSQKLTATPRAADGSALEGREVQWSSSNPGAVLVDGDGVASAVGVGVALVTALIDGRTGTANLTILVRPVERVELTPASAQIFVAATQQFTATPRAADGSALSGRSIVWSSADPNVARVDGLGLVTGVSPGDTKVSVSVEGKSASADVTVSLAPVATVDVNPAAGQILIGSTRQLVATARDSGGRELTDRGVAWSSSDGGIATVSSTGLVTGVAVGSATITATIEGKQGSARFVVAAVPIASVEVSPATASIHVGETQQLTARLEASDGTVLYDRSVNWTSSAPSIASVENGLVIGNSTGQATITATSEGISGSASVTVMAKPVASVKVTPATSALAEGETEQLTVKLEAADGTVLSGRTVSWSSSASAIASVDNSGHVTGRAAGGPVTITATSEGESGTASVSVFAPVASVSISPGGASLFIGETEKFAATTRDADGDVLTGREVTWSSTAGSIASVNQSGVASAKAVGTARIVAASEGKADTVVVTVKLRPVATVDVDPGSASVAVGTTEQLSATLKASDGSVLTGRTVTWSSSSPGIASVNGSSGLVSGVAAGGPVTITATSEGKSGSASVTVFIPVASVTISPSGASMFLGGSQQFTATARSASGATLGGRPVEWSSTAPSVVSVSDNGVARGEAAGEARIIATVEGKADTASVTVNDVPVASVVVTPSSAHILLGATEQLTATTRASTGAVLTGRTVTWTSDKESVASVSETGLVTSNGPGKAKITATSEGKDDDAEITVIQPVATVTVSPTSANLRIGERRQFSATARAADGSELSGRDVTWSSSNPLVASVNGNGRVTAGLLGEATITATIEGVEGTATVRVTLTEEVMEASGP